jgi:beta-xylosidase
MKTDNSKYFEEKFQEGYIKRCNELVHTNLFVVETNLYELTDEQRDHFYNLWEGAKHDTTLQNEALDYIQDFGKCLNTITHCYNY